MPSIIEEVRKTMKHLKREMKAWKDLDHGNIVKFIGFAIEVRGAVLEAALVSEWCSNGNLVQYLRRKPSCDRLPLLLDVARGLTYLHDHDPVVIHGDLKPLNILISEAERAKLCDFGLSWIADGLTTGYTSSGPAFTSRYCAPEVFDSDIKTTCSDVYSFACTCTMILFDESPFPSLKKEAELFDALKSGRSPWDWKQSSPVEKILSSCCAVSPDARLTMGEVFRSLVDTCARLDSSSSSEIPDLKTELLPPAGFTDGSVASFSALSGDRADPKLATSFKKAAIKIKADGQVAPVSVSPDFQNGISGEKQKQVQPLPKMTPELFNTEEVASVAISPEAQDGVLGLEPLPGLLLEDVSAKSLKMVQAGETTRQPGTIGVDITFVSPPTPESPMDPVPAEAESSLTPASRALASPPSREAHPSQPSEHARNIRSASASSSGAVRDGAHSSRKPSQPKQVNGQDTEAEATFDTDVERPTDTGIVTPIKPHKKRASRIITVSDFEMMRMLGISSAGKVLLVKHKASGSLYALKAIKKRDVLAQQELGHTLTEQAVLKRMTDESQNAFVVKLWWSFHDKENLFLVMDFHPGGDLGIQLARWGRLGRDRARFYAAEIVEGVEGLHAAGVVYRNLKPKNVLIGFDGHLVLTDFGLSKQFPSPYLNLSGSSTATDGAVLPRWMTPDQSPNSWRNDDLSNKDFTDTFCGTPEYLAPEVIQGLQYSYEVDWWAFGTMLYEMLSGVTPFWADNHSDMYVRVLRDELQFPKVKAFDQDTKALIRGLLQRNPTLRTREPRIKTHSYFSMTDWSHVYYKRYIPPYIPPIDSSNASNTQNFDDAFLDMSPTPDDGSEPVTDSERESTEDEPLDSDTSSSGKTPSGSLSGRVNTASQQDTNEEAVDIFDGYSFKGRHSVVLDDEDEYDEADSDIEETPALPEVDTVLEITPDDASDVSIKARHHPPTPAVVRREPPAELEAALGTPLLASPAKSVHAELTSPEEPVSQETVDKSKSSIQDLVYDPSPVPCIRFEPPATDISSKPFPVSNFDGLGDEGTDVPPRSKDDDDDDGT
ncbi:kinase-like domain-containing protein [Cantharellus anzutake]|uniref:kinase-like domain-containing protein n=1 Tax=Cantharellus anzutake TaxID=1750568 RepID=UPI001903CDBA|nr:kinase-like domain-containing protein [Cantharellus anzutake]KAF8317489.1 kinase-like domain-containing protein [Cantharellus anzutake]